MSSGSWRLTRELSPRATVRVDGTDAYGQRTNTYDETARITGEEPASPWAMYLAVNGQFRYLCLDLDAKTPAASQLVAEHAAAIATVLNDHGIAHVICDSGGPYSGRHIWIALAEPLPAETARQLGVFARAQWPTLDTAPISNPRTGCVRPPGAPHRSGGYSRILHGDLDTLRRPTTTTHQVAALVSHLAALVDAHSTTQAQASHGPLPVDDHGHVYLPGVRRSLSPAAAAALRDREAAQGDASAALFRVLLGAAAARWRYADVAELVDAQPGLEHVRTTRDRSGRTQRPAFGPASPARVLRRQWDKAVRQIASSGKQGTDPTFDARAGAIAALVRLLQQRADATAGRWHRGGGPADRRVLDVLCMLALQAVSGRVEADIRRVALLAGIGRETARTALLRLAADGWIARTAAADGPHGARWSIDPTGVIHRESEDSRSQADPRPEGAGAAERSLQLTALNERTRAARHDLFTTGHTLGIRTGNLYARLTTEPLQLHELHTQTGSPVLWISYRLDLLQRLGLARRNQSGWIRTPLEARNRLAQQLGVAGRLEERRERYDVERELWAWWCAELTWMTTPRKQKPRNRPGPGQLALIPDVGTNRRGAHPRRPDGKADFKLAREYITSPPEPVTKAKPLAPASPVDSIIASVLGGRLVEVLPLPTAVEAVRTA